MINYVNRNKFRKDSVNKQFEIVYTNDSGIKTTIKNTDLYQGEFELTETLCSENELRFGACESCSIKFKIDNGGRKSLIGKKLEVYITLDGDTAHKFKLGTYFVDSDKETADRSAREIVAYDAMKQIINHDISAWYNNYVLNNTSKTIKDIRTAFFTQDWVKALGVTQANATLPNDGVLVLKNIQAEQFSALDFLRAVCELNGVFGHINRNNQFVYVSLPQIGEGLYPAEDLYPNNKLTPKDSGANDSIGKAHYIKCEYESYETVPIDGIQIRKEEGDIGGAYPTNTNYTNGYVIEDNFFAYGYGTSDLNAMCTRLKPNILGRTYRPSKVEIVGDPTLEVGDGIRVVSEREIFITYILERTMKGIQSLKDTYTSKGVEKYGSKVNSWQTSIIQLKNKTNILKRTSEETLARIEDLNGDIAEVQLTATDFAIRLNGSSQVIDERIDTTNPNSAVYPIKYRGIATPSKSNVKSPTENDYYLNTTNRRLYQYKSDAWSLVTTLPLVTNALSSKFAMTDKEISAKVAEKGGTNKTFSWSLTVDGFTLYSDSTKVLDVDRKGNLSVRGNVIATSGEFGSGSRKWTIGKYKYGTDNASTGYALYCDKPSLNDTDASGVYVGTDGIALGKDSFKVDRSGNLVCKNADISGKVTATSGSFTGNITCKSLTLDGIHLTNSMFTDDSISGLRIKQNSIDGTRVSSIKAGQVTAGKINNRDVTWQRIEYMTGENQVAVYSNSGSLSLTPSYPNQSPSGYLVSSIQTSAIYTLAQANAPQ